MTRLLMLVTLAIGTVVAQSKNKLIGNRDELQQ